MLVVVSCVVWLGLGCAGEPADCNGPDEASDRVEHHRCKGASGFPFVLADFTKLVPQRFCVFPLLRQYESNAEVTFLRESSVSIAAFYRW
jgi:hypothetical protein